MEGTKNGASTIVYLNGEGKVIGAANLDAKGNPLNTKIEYEEEEKILGSNIIGAMLYSPNGCCWRLVGGVWKCRRRYCR